MKVTTNIIEFENTYPCLKILHTWHGKPVNMIVYFYAPKCGIVMDKGTSASDGENGDHRRCFCEEQFDDFCGSITLEQ